MYLSYLNKDVMFNSKKISLSLVMLSSILCYRNMYTMLLSAASDGNVELVKQLVKNGANVNIQNREGATPLHMAASGGQVEILPNAGAIVEILLKAGADVNIQDTDGDTPLHYAAYKGHTEAVEALLNAGAYIHKK